MLSETQKSRFDKRSGFSVLVGVTGFEPATFATPLQRATKLRHTPMSVWHLPQDGAYTSALLAK